MMIPARAFPGKETKRFHVSVEKNMTHEVLRIAETIADRYEASEGARPSVLVVHSDKKFGKKYPASPSAKAYSYHDKYVARSDGSLIGDDDYAYYDDYDDEADDSIVLIGHGYSLYHSGNERGIIRISATSPSAIKSEFNSFVHLVSQVDKAGTAVARGIYNRLLRREDANVTCECGCSKVRFLDRLYKHSSGVFTMKQPERAMPLIAHHTSVMDLSEVFFDIVITVMAHSDFNFYSQTTYSYNLKKIMPKNVFYITREHKKYPTVSAAFSAESENRCYLIRLTKDPRDVAEVYGQNGANSEVTNALLHESYARRFSATLPLFVLEQPSGLMEKTLDKRDSDAFAALLLSHAADSIIAASSRGNKLPHLEGIKELSSSRRIVRAKNTDKTLASSFTMFAGGISTVLLSTKGLIPADIGGFGFLSAFVLSPVPMIAGMLSSKQSSAVVSSTAKEVRAQEKNLLSAATQHHSVKEPVSFDEINDYYEYMDYLDEEVWEAVDMTKNPTSPSSPSTLPSSNVVVQEVSDENMVIHRTELLRERWVAYELDPIMLLEYPLMSDATCPETGAFLHSYEKLSVALASYQEGRGATLSSLGAVLEEAEKAFITAESNAKKVRKSYLTQEQRKRLATARQLALLALDEEASPNERLSAWKKANDHLEGIMLLPDTPVRGLLTAA